MFNDISEEHQQIRDMVRRVALEKVAPRADEIDATAEYPQDMFEQAQRDLDDILIQAASMALSSNEPLSNHQRLSGKDAEACQTCPFNRGLTPICGPAEM